MPTIKRLTGCLTMLLLCVIYSPWGQSVTTSRKVPHLIDETTRYYSHIHWQQQPGAPVPVKLLPSVNATGKHSYSIQHLSGKDHQSEVRTIPQALDRVVEQLVSNSQFLRPALQNYQYYAQVHLKQYDSLYALGDSNHLLSVSFGHLDRLWSQLNGDNKPAKVALTLVIYDTKMAPILEIPVYSQMMPCQRSGFPMTFSMSRHQRFYDGFATTTSGQTFIAAINRALVEVNHYFKHHPITGEVLEVDDNEIYINIGQGVVYKNEQLELIYQPQSGRPSYAVSRLQVEQTWQDSALVHALDIPSANVQPGDVIELKKVMGIRQFKSVAGEPILCHPNHKKVEQESVEKREASHWQWQTEE